jgi:hypothetical protein
MICKKLLFCSLLLVLASMAISQGARAEKRIRPTFEQEYELFQYRPLTNEDMLILKRADKILSDETIWNRNDTRKCLRLMDSWSLFCALREACIEVTGKFNNRRVAIEEVRFVVEEVAGWGDRKSLFHPLMEYNNLPTTKFEDIKKVLKTAMEREAARMNRME